MHICYWQLVYMVTVEVIDAFDFMLGASVVSKCAASDLFLHAHAAMRDTT